VIWTRLLVNKTAVITGAGSQRGIGRATAKLFAAHGARIAAVDIDGEAVLDVATELGAQHRAWCCDVSDPAECNETVAQIVDDFQGIDIMVNSAGVVFGTPILEITQREYDTVLDNNLRGSFLMSQAVIPHMRTKSAGSIICISSIAGETGGGVFGSSHYAAAKSGIFGLVKALARELAPDGIRANAVAPGPVDNDFTKGSMTQEIKDEIAKKIPLGRLATPDDIANVCLFLASDLSSYVTGTVFDVNGGLLMH